MAFCGSRLRGSLWSENRIWPPVDGPNAWRRAQRAIPLARLAAAAYQVRTIGARPSGQERNSSAESMGISLLAARENLQAAHHKHK